jgi:uncharacterized protein YgbK (DUF1537 family)
MERDGFGFQPPHMMHMFSSSNNMVDQENDVADSLAEAAAGLANLNNPVASSSTSAVNFLPAQIITPFVYQAHPDPEDVLRTMLAAGSFTDQTHEQCAYILQRIDQVKTLERCNCLSGTSYIVYYFYPLSILFSVFSLTYFI